MRCIRVAIGLVLVTLGSSRALGEDGDIWSSQVNLGVQGTLTETTPLGLSTPVSRTATVTPTADVYYFLQPLVDEEDGELALLLFYQHPGSLSLSLDLPQNLEDTGTGFRSISRSVGLTAAAQDYFWQESGLEASVGANDQGVAGFNRGQTSLSYTAGFLHYFNPSLRGEIAYVGSVTQSDVLVASSASGSLQSFDDATNEARVSAKAVMLHDRLSVEARVQIGEGIQSRTAVSLNGQPLPGDYSTSLLYEAQAQVGTYIGRQLSLYANLGVDGESLETTPDAQTLPISHRNTLTPELGPQVQFYFIDNFYGTLTYTLGFPTTHGDLAPSEGGIEQVATLNLGARF
jgi:hypothetical protein